MSLPTLRVPAVSGRPEVLLRPFAVEEEAEARAAHAELAAENFDFLLDPYVPGRRSEELSWAEWLHGHERHAEGLDLPRGHVPALFLAAEAHGQLAGRVSVRLDLNAWLETFGGNIGYGVRPAFRRRGVASQILAGALQLLGEARDVTSAVVTCDPENRGSEAVIRGAGGAPAPVPDGEGRSRFLVPVPAR
ncbi:GNAT family N-acetyltransferase [Zhihengliuella sp.]|uniref:GNAT family N-acetyltransferase n=1 Tax=Zhihengliuella sp. TaxID=1954483 RepID=UPI0028122420|nr:GNAT family N-acetyltransferase [Zhihengliuella sp.]